MVFPLFVIIVVHQESRRIHGSPVHLLKTLFFLAAMRALLLKTHANTLRQGTLATPQ